MEYRGAHTSPGLISTGAQAQQTALDAVEARLAKLVEAGHAHNCRTDSLIDNLIGSEPTPVAPTGATPEPHCRLARISCLLDELEAATEWRQRIINRLERV